MNYKTKKSGFTLMELMITVVIMGVMAGFGIPTYTKAVARTRERDARMNLEVIREAVRLYRVRENGNIPPDQADVAAINVAFHLNIIEQEGNSYDCDSTGLYTCYGRNGANWIVSFNIATNDGAIVCDADSPGACPTL